MIWKICLPIHDSNLDSIAITLKIKYFSYEIYNPFFGYCHLIQMFIFLFQWLETETVRLSHLRDRASEKGRRKEYPFFFRKT